MRNPVVVLERIQSFLPDNLKKELEWWIDDAIYKAPEQWPSVFRRIHEKIIELVGLDLPLKVKWKIQVILIFSDKTIYDLISSRIVNNDDINDFIDELKLPELKVESE